MIRAKKLEAQGEMLRVHLSVAGVLDLTVAVGKSGAAPEGGRGCERESRAREEYEQRRRLAAAQLVDRFRRSGGFDYDALREASERWLRE